ncbi:MAG: glycoside hydrolase family 5 protein [Planctomycetaceae bacterium]|jgi:aryl-phospho-beta-D-glucosidase BglC (GH1 family)|nr:glycoside hydrolase family 5 protein [Planctomycetaceae bacterium]
MKNTVILFFALFTVCPLFADGLSDVVLKEFTGGEKLPVGWNVSLPQAAAVKPDGVKVELPANGKDRHASVTKTLPVEQLRGTRLRVAVQAKAENVAEPPKPYNGIKAMLVLDTPGGKQWLQQNVGGGTFGWKEIAFNAAVPADTTAATFLLGLEDTTGKVEFQSLTITVIAKKRSKVVRSETSHQPIYRGHHLSRLRGAMISPDNFGKKDIEVFGGQWKANHVRWQLIWSGFPNGPADTATVEEYNVWLEKQCKHLDEMLPLCKQYGVYVCLDLHTPPGGRLPRNKDSAMRMFYDEKFQDAFVAAWEKLAKRYKDAEMVWSYDILNEPVEGNMPEQDGLLHWRDLALKTSKAIRRVDPVKAIVIEGEPWGGPDALEWFEPFDPKEVPNVIYSAHCYVPHPFTHQGVYDSPTGLKYPGEIGGKYWDKNELRKALRVPAEFAKDYGVSIYIGEFSAIRWSPDGSAYRYLKDCIDIFEEQGWDWAYHAFREWDGWSVEHGSDPKDHKPAAEPTDRELLLRSWFEKNER